MDIATIIGIVSGIGLVIVSILMNSGLGIFVSIPSLMIVLGGTIAATLVAYPLKEFMSVMGLLIRVFIVKTKDPEKVIEMLMELASNAKKGGLLTLEKSIKDIDDPFLVNALQMTVDGAATSAIIKSMKQEISFLKKKHKVGWEIFSTMGGYSPAFGMVGTLIGLVQMLSSLDDPSTIGPKMAVAMITTFYGTLFANLFFLPMSMKLERRSAKETVHMALLQEGVIGIREGVNPRTLEDRLSIYLDSKKKDDEKGKEKGK